MRFPEEIFRAYDIRGVVGHALSEDLVERIGRALAAEALARGVTSCVIGRDGRLSSPVLAGALARGLRAGGCDVIDIGQAPTPALYFAAAKFEIGTGVQVTGSHNPPEYNGLKMMLAGETLCGEAIQALMRRVIQGDFSTGRGALTRRDVLGEYTRAIESGVTLARPLDVVIDCGNGVAGAVAPEVFRRIGCRVSELFCEVDGNFPNHHPDPSRPENLRDLVRAVTGGGADLGLAFDGDGDRLGVVSAHGEVIWPDRQMALFARAVLAERPGAEIIYDVKCSQVLPRVIGECGGRATICKTGHSFIRARLRQTGAALAGEMSGHIFFNDRWGGFDDGIYAGARLCELLAAPGVDPARAFAEIPDTVNTPELRLDLAEGEQHRLVDELVAQARFDDAEVTTIDGVRVDFQDGFGLVRASNTTPSLVMRFEAADAAGLERIQQRFRELILSVRPGLELPF